MPPKIDPIVLIFHDERETKTKKRFQEMMKSGPDLVIAPKDKAVVEKLYVAKKDLKKLQNPTVLRVTIEVVQ